MRNRPIHLLPLLTLCAPLHAQEPENVTPRAWQGGGAVVEIFTGAQLQLTVSDIEEVDKFTAPLAARLTTGPLRIGAQLPYVRVKGAGNVVPPSGPLGPPGAT